MQSISGNPSMGDKTFYEYFCKSRCSFMGLKKTITNKIDNPFKLKLIRSVIFVIVWKKKFTYFYFYS